MGWDNKPPTVTEQYDSNLAQKAQAIDPGALPWQEETISRNRDSSKRLKALVSTNKKLKLRLQAISGQLTEVLDIIEQRPQYSHPTQSKPRSTRAQSTSPRFENERSSAEMDLATAKKKLARFKKEHAHTKKKYNSFQDPNHQVALRESIEKSKVEEITLKQQIKSARKEQGYRSKNLSVMLESGENAEQREAFAQLTGDIAFFTKKIHELEIKGSRNTNSISIMSEREGKASKAQQDSRSTLEFLPKEDRNSQLDVWQEEINTATIEHQKRLKAIQASIAKYKVEIASIQPELNRKMFESKRKEETLTDLISRLRTKESMLTSLRSGSQHSMISPSTSKTLKKHGSMPSLHAVSRSTFITDS